VESKKGGEEVKFEFEHTGNTKITVGNGKLTIESVDKKQRKRRRRRKKKK
jgi:hypothetical protein